jgi:hypothetical protein
MKIVHQSLFLIASFAVVFVWQYAGLEKYTVQAIGFLILAFLIIAARDKSRRIYIDSGISVFILNSIILLLIFSTGIFESNLFFLIYFLLFGVAVVFDPRLIFLFVGGIVLVLLGPALEKEIFANGLKLVSFIIISPLAYFFGTQYNKTNQEQEEVFKVKERAKEAADNIAEEVGGLIKDKKGQLGHEDLNRLNEILEEAEDLRAETKER